MTDTPTLTGVPTAGRTSAQTAPVQSTDKLISPDFATFLRMLTTQLKNQDPLNPMDNSEYAVQLATFSGVEQQVRTNTLLESLGSQLGLTGLTQYAGWVGKEGRADMPVWFKGDPVTVAATPDPLADSAVLVVRDSAGTVVAQQPAPKKGGTFSFAGTDQTGAILPVGQYSFSVESYAKGILTATAPAETYARITEARGGATPTLIFEGGIEVDAKKVTALRGT
jgi:flagellar basal-body rod modification protein FlgD